MNTLSIESIDSDLLDFANQEHCFYDKSSPWYFIEEGRHLLSLLLLFRFKGAKSNDYEKKLFELINQYRLKPYWKEFQLASAYVYILCRIVGLPFDFPGYFLDDSGSAPLETHGHWRWALTPHAPLQAELGLIWTLVATLFGDDVALEAAIKMGRWHLNTLDHQGQPFIGLFSTEQLANPRFLTSVNALFFGLLGLKTKDKDFLSAAGKLIPSFEKDYHPEKVPRLFALLKDHYLKDTSFFDKKKAEPAIFDITHSLIGKREKKESVVLCLAGGGTSMGAMHSDQVSLLSFGPQHYPLSDTSSFGVMGFSCIKGKEKKFVQLELLENRLQIQGIVRTVGGGKPTLTLANWMNKIPSDIWMDVKLGYAKKILNISFQFVESKEETIAYTFFFKAKSCEIDEKTILLPQTLERFSGKAGLLKFIADEETFTLTAMHEGEVDVTPLSGLEGYWGADFMAAYKIPVDKKTYSWSITAVS